MIRPSLLAAAATLALAAAVPAHAQSAMPPLSTDPTAAAAGVYKLDKNHASVTAKIQHLGLSAYTLRFKTLDGSYSYDPKNPAASKVTVSIAANSVDTGDAKFDQEIAGKFLGATATPTIAFVSTGVQAEAGGRGKLAGSLTLNGVTKPVVIDLIYNGSRKGMRGEDRMGFSGVTTVRRSDFNVAKPLPATVVGDDVAIMIEAEFTK